MYKIIQKRKIGYIISIVIMLPGLFFLFRYGLALGIDFTGGSMLEISSDIKIEQSSIKNVYTEHGVDSPHVTYTENGSARIQSMELSTEKHNEILIALKNVNGTIQELGYANIGPVIGNELKQKAIYATTLVFLFIVLYITWSFRKASTPTIKSWSFGLAAVIALLHDLVVVLGIFAFLGKFYHVQIDTLFITALLTVLGFSVHDTIVVFDRIRERIRTHVYEETFEDLVNTSINQTLVRSLATSLTVVLVLISLYLFGGESIRVFILALLIGMFSGTYSSIFVASPLLVSWHSFKNKE